MTDTDISMLRRGLLIGDAPAGTTTPDAVPSEVPDEYADFLHEFGSFFSDEVLVVSALEDAPPYRDADGFLSLTRLLGLDGDESSRLCTAIEDYAGRLPRGMMPIGFDPYDNVFCLSVGDPSRPGVWFWRHDVMGDEDDPSLMTLVSPDFRDFLLGIRIDNRNGTIREYAGVDTTDVRWVDPSKMEPVRSSLADRCSRSDRGIP